MIKKVLVLAFVGLFAVCDIRLASANDFCDLDSVLASYKAALNRKKYGDIESAAKTFLRLAKIGVAPAQRHVAQYYLEDARSDQALETAIMWAQLAKWGGDREGAVILKRAVDAARHQVANVGLEWARDWRPEPADCAPVEGFKKSEDDDFQVVGRFPIIRQDGVDEEVFAAFATRLGDALQTTQEVAPYFAPLAQLIPAFEVIKGEGSDRFMQWDEEQDWLRISSAYLSDQTSRQLAYSLILNVQRRLYDKVKDGDFEDQIATHYGKIRIYGSLYGDVKTADFLPLMSEAIKEARHLPVILRDKVNFLDEIHYMPPSRYHDTRMPSTKRFATYDHIRSHPDKRIMVVTHKLAFENTNQLILELVRVGELAQQHVKIEAMRSQIGGKKREDAILKALEGGFENIKQAFGEQTAKQQKIITDWDQSGPDGIQRIYCESIFAQVKAAIALKMDPSEVSQRVKFGNCRKARQAWADRNNGETKK